MTSTAFTLRQATSADHDELSTLAQLDSQRYAADQYTVAEIDGRIVAAVSNKTGNAIADPFRRTSELVDLIRQHITSATVRQTRRHLSVRRPRAAVVA